MADPQGRPDLGLTIADEGGRHRADDDMRDVGAPLPCGQLVLPGRKPLLTQLLCRQELVLLRWSCADPTVRSVVLEAIEAGQYDTKRTKELAAKLATSERVVERTAQHSVLSTRESDGIRALVSEITEHFPPAEYLYVSLGSSPTLITTALLLATKNAIVVDLPISNVGMEVSELDESQWTALLAFASAAMEGKADARGKIVIIDVLQQGRGVAFARTLLQRHCGKGKDIRICSLGQIDRAHLGQTLNFGKNGIYEAGKKNRDAEMVCNQIAMCTYKNIKLLRKYEQHPMMQIANRKMLAPKKDVAMAFRLLHVIKDELSWVKPSENHICGTILEQIMSEHDIVRAIDGICEFEANEDAVGWLWGVIKHEHGLTVRGGLSQKTRFYQLFRAQFSNIMEWIRSSESVNNEAKKTIEDGLEMTLKPPAD